MTLEHRSLTHRRHIGGILYATHISVVHFERDRHGVDVMEHVFRGVQVVTDGNECFSRDAIDLEVRTWLAGTAISTVHIRVLERDDR